MSRMEYLLLVVSGGARGEIGRWRDLPQRLTLVTLAQVTGVELEEGRKRLHPDLGLTTWGLGANWTVGTPGFGAAATAGTVASIFSIATGTEGAWLFITVGMV